MERTEVLRQLRYQGRAIARQRSSAERLRGEMLDLAERGRASGATVAEMAEALGVAESTLGVALWKRRAPSR